MKPTLKNPPPGIRGAALVETALVVGVVLIFILGTIQMGVIGYLQMSADAAAFTSARQDVIGVGGGTPQTDTAAIFPQVAPSDINFYVHPVPSATVYVDYGYNSSNPAVVAGSANDRHGGATMMQPTLLESQVIKSNAVSILGVPISPGGSMIEPQWLENGLHFDVANENEGAVDTGFQGNYFTAGENTAPYYLGSGLMQHCRDSQPWPGPNCSTPTNTDFIALGMAEHLDDSVWGITAGQEGTSGTWGTGTATPGASAHVFQQMACHQRHFAQIAQFLDNVMTTANAAGTDPLTWLWQNYAVPETINAATRPDGELEPMFQQFSGFTPRPFVSDGGLGAATNAAIVDTYSWDREVHGGYPDASYTGVGSYPLYPYMGC